MFIYINIFMSKIKILLTGDNNQKREFEYTLTDSSASQSFLNVWQQLFSAYNNTTQYFDFECPTPTQSVDHLNQVIYDICADIVKSYPEVVIPVCWTETPYTQSSLNILHDKFAESTHNNPDLFLLQRLKDLNFAIHNLEARVLNEKNKLQDIANFPPYVSSFSLASLENEFKQTLTIEDAQSYDVNFKDLNCLIIGYNTLGKDLQALVFDDDINSMKNNDRYVPKTTIMSQFSMIVPYTELSEEQQTLQSTATKQRIHDWCNKNNSKDYGVDPDHFTNWPGRLVIGYMPHSVSHWTWIMDQSNIIISRIIFETSNWSGEITRAPQGDHFFKLHQYS